MNLKEMSIMDLVAAEQAATAVRKKYEDKSVAARSGLSDTMLTHPEEIELSRKLMQFNSLKMKIIQEMEERLLTLE
jgi:hypothetical protein